MRDVERDGQKPEQIEAPAPAAPTPGKSPLIVQRSAGGKAPSDPGVVQPIAEQGVASGGGPVPFKADMERGFGTSFDNVSFHSGSGAQSASKAIGADAYTMGNSIAMAATPTPSLVAHELAHVVQQRSGAGPSSGVGSAGDSFEREADHAASQVAAGGTSDLAGRYGGMGAMGGAVQRMTVQRFESGEHAMIGVGGAASTYPFGQGDLTLTSGAQIFMGEMVAFGDFYADMAQLQEAPRQEVEALAGTCRWEAVWYQARRMAAQLAHNGVANQVAPGAPGGSAILPGQSTGNAEGAHVAPGAVPGAPPGGAQENRLRNQVHELPGGDNVWHQQLGTTGITLEQLRQQIHDQFAPVWALFGISFNLNTQPETGMAMVRATLGRRRFRSGGGGDPRASAGRDSAGHQVNQGENDALSRPGDPNAPNATRDPSRMGGDYLDLAQNNLSHFTTDNWDNWLEMHRAACAAHSTATTPQQAQMALATDMMGNHFLTDRFSTGHFVDKAELMTYATGMMTETARAHMPARRGESNQDLLNRELSQAVSACFADENVLIAWREGVRQAQQNGVLGEREAGLLAFLPAGQIAPRLTGVIMGMPWRSFNPGEAGPTGGDARNYGPAASVARGSARAAPTPSSMDQVTGAGDYHLGVGNLAALQVHDALNAIGFTVRNGAGNQWRAQGDDHMSAETQEIANRCVQESQAQVNRGVSQEATIARYLPTEAWIDPTWISDYFLGQWGTSQFDATQLNELRAFVSGKRIPINFQGGHRGVSPEMTEICHRIMRILFMPPTGASAVQSDAGTGLNISMLKAFLIARLGEMVSMAYLSTSAADLPQQALEMYAPRDPASRSILPRAANNFTWRGNQLDFDLNVTECNPGTYSMVGHLWNRESGYDVNPQGQMYGRGNGEQEGGWLTGSVRALGGATNNAGGPGGIGGTNQDRFVRDVHFDVVVEPGGTDPRAQRYQQVSITVPREGGFFTDEGDRYVIIAGDAGGQCAIGRSNVASDGQAIGNPAPGGGMLPVATGAGAPARPVVQPHPNGIVDNAFRWDNNTVLFSLTLDQTPTQDGEVTVYIREMDWDLIGSDAQNGAPRAVTARVFANTPHSQTIVHTPREDNWNDTYVQVFSDQGCTHKLGESRSQGHDRGRIESMRGRNPAHGVSGMVWSGAVLRFRVEPPDSDSVYVKFFDKDWGFDYDESGHSRGGPSNTDPQIGGIHVVQVTNGNASVTSNGDSDTYAIVYADPACTQPLHRSGTHG